MSKGNEPTKHERFLQRHTARMQAEGFGIIEQSKPVQMETGLWTQFREALRNEGAGPVKKATGLTMQVLSDINNRGIALPENIERITSYLSERAQRVAASLEGTTVSTAPALTNSALA